MTGKGSGRRPQKVNSTTFSESWDKIFKPSDKATTKPKNDTVVSGGNQEKGRER